MFGIDEELLRKHLAGPRGPSKLAKGLFPVLREDTVAGRAFDTLVGAGIDELVLLGHLLVLHYSARLPSRPQRRNWIAPPGLTLRMLRYLPQRLDRFAVEIEHLHRQSLFAPADLLRMARNEREVLLRSRLARDLTILPGVIRFYGGLLKARIASFGRYRKGIGRSFPALKLGILAFCDAVYRDTHRHYDKEVAELLRIVLPTEPLDLSWAAEDIRKLRHRNIRLVSSAVT